MLPADDELSAVLKRDRYIVGGALAVLIALAWAYTLFLSAQMSMPSAATPGMPDMQGMAGMPGMVAPAFMTWTAVHAGFVFAMWMVMMVGMMTPSAAPMVLIYAQIARQAQAQGGPFAPTGWFTAGYLSAWLLFAGIATAAQAGLEYAALLSPAMASTNRWFGSGVLIAAGLYQFLPLKDVCLAQCRTPLAFLQKHGGFKPEATGSLLLGFRHGLYCIGCCWILMALLFVGGVMNVLWIAGLMILVLLEKVAPGGRYIGWAAGLTAFAAGGWMLLR